ncbi:MAG: PEGA domain-containing protein [Deltaproteobacteria bacterium]|jgi:hypothetical protein|nr:PEGA domain-containing protein [Deltaproteobacteria bacterium]
MSRLTLLLLICVSLTAADADARRRPKTPDPAARAFARGTRLFKQMDYQGAVEAFGRSYKLAPHFLTLCNMARCHARMNDMVKAAETYRRCLQDGGGESKMSERLANDLAKVEARITSLRVTSAGQGGTVHVNGRAVGQTPQTIPLNPGSHVIEVRRDGAKPASATVQARGGQSTLELTPVDLAPPTPPAVPVLVEPEPEPKPEPEPRSGLSSTWFWVGAGTTVALAAASTVMSVLTLKASQDFDDGPTWDGYNKVIDYRLVTNILWGATAAVGGTTTVLFFFTDFGGKASDDDEAASLGIGIRGRF